MVLMRMMLALPVMMRCRPLGDLPFVIRDKKGEKFWDKSSLVHRERISIGYFLLGGVFIHFEGCNEVYMYFLSFTLASCILVL